MWSAIAFPLLAVLGSAFGGGDPTLKIRIDKLSMETKDNPWFDNWEGTIHPGELENEISAKLHVKSDIPENVVMQFQINLDGSPLIDEEKVLCEVLDDEVVADPIIAALSPTFSKKCPIKQEKYELDHYSIVKDKIPQGVPDGKVDGSINIAEPDQEPIVIITFSGEIYHKVQTLG